MPEDHPGRPVQVEIDASEIGLDLSAHDPLKVAAMEPASLRADVSERAVVSIDEVEAI